MGINNGLLQEWQKTLDCDVLIYPITLEASINDAIRQIDASQSLKISTTLKAFFKIFPSQFQNHLTIPKNQSFSPIFQQHSPNFPMPNPFQQIFPNVLYNQFQSFGLPMIKIYFTTKLMQNSMGPPLSKQQQIINLAINVFQNVGIKRWIDQIQILKNEQIYIDICKIIFSGRIIQLIRINENPQLTTSDKIQCIINLIAKEIKNDLYHISGEAISRGNLHHLKNFLQLLEALSNQIVQKGRLQVQSAPQNDQSFNTQDNHSYYTVIGIDKEFQKIIQSEEDEPEYQRPVKHNQQPRHYQPQIQIPNQHDSAEASSQQSSQERDFPIKPTNQNKNQAQKKYSNKKQMKGKQPSSTQKQSQRKTKNTNYKTTSFKKKAVRRLPYPIHSEEYTVEEAQLNGRWLDLTRRMNQTRQALQKQRMDRIQAQFQEEKKEMQLQHKNQMKMIDREMEERKKYVTQKIGLRDKMLKSLKGEKEAKKTIRDLFRQEKKVKKQQLKKLRQRESKEIDKIMDFNEFSALFQQAVNSNQRHQSSRRE